MSDEPDDAERSYNVGYSRPPAHTRFGKGQSGNPGGRPRGSKNFTTVLESELKSRIPITENGRRKKITKKEAIAKQLINKAVTGDARATPLVLNEIRNREGLMSGANGELDQLVPQSDQLVIENILERMRQAEQPSSLENVSDASEPAPAPVSMVDVLETHTEKENDDVTEQK